MTDQPNPVDPFAPVPPPPPPSAGGQAPPPVQPVPGTSGFATAGAPGYPAYQQPVPDIGGKKLAAGILGILLGSLGIHKFVLGYTGAGLVMLLVTVLTCGIGGIVMGIIGLIEGIVYLTKSDAEFYNTYVLNEKKWF